MQAGLVLRDFFFSDFALIRLENSQHFSNLRNIFGFTPFGIDYFWPRVSSVGVLRKVTLLSRHQSRVWIDYGGDTIARFI